MAPGSPIEHGWIVSGRDERQQANATKRQKPGADRLKVGSESTFQKSGQSRLPAFGGQHLAGTGVLQAMPRRRRSDLAGFPLHLIQRGNNRSACFFTDADRLEYLLWLGHYAKRFAVAIHAWVLMGNHVHLLVTPSSPAHASRLMQALGRRYVRYVNESRDRTGTLWEGRFRACAVHSEDYLLVCMRYIELNPVRAGLAQSPDEYRWSSYRGNALGHPDPLLTEHPLYTGLGVSAAARLGAYRQMFAGHIRDAELVSIRSATTSGHLLASEKSRKKFETERGLLLGPAPIGRPKAPNDSRSHEIELLPFSA